MGFYYISIFNLMLLGVVYAALAFALWGIAHFTRGMPGRKTLLAVVGTAFLVGPVAEELWIAWHFGQACKEAGRIISKIVTVDGFYDDTRSTHTGPPTAQMVESFEKTGYRFLEMKGPNGRVVHIEKSDGLWNSAVLDRPTARYHYTQPYAHARVALKVRKNERQVLDAATKEILAREVNFGRDAPWFYVGLDAPVMLCYGRTDPKMKGSIYTHTLLPGKEGR